MAGQDLTALFTDSRPIAFKTVENANNILVIVFDELLAKTHDVGSAGRALLFTTLALGEHRSDGHQCQQSRKSSVAKHDAPHVESEGLSRWDLRSRPFAKSTSNDKNAQDVSFQKIGRRSEEPPTFRASTWDRDG
jgi:hypothetical protein